MEQFADEDRRRVGTWLRQVRLAGGPEWRDVEVFSKTVGRSSRQIRGMERGERVGRETYAVVADELGLDYERLAIALNGGPLPSEDVPIPAAWPASRPFLQPWEPYSTTVGGGRDEAGRYTSAVSAIRTKDGAISHMEMRYYPGDSGRGLDVRAAFDLAHSAHQQAIDATEPLSAIYAREGGAQSSIRTSGPEDRLLAPAPSDSAIVTPIAPSPPEANPHVLPRAARKRGRKQDAGGDAVGEENQDQEE